MPRFEITESGANNLEVGSVVEAAECPAWLVGKCKVVAEPPPKELEVATPQRGRPKKQKDEESPD